MGGAKSPFLEENASLTTWIQQTHPAHTNAMSAFTRGHTCAQQTRPTHTKYSRHSPQGATNRAWTSTMPAAPAAAPVVYDQNVFALAEQAARLLETTQHMQQQRQVHQVRAPAVLSNPIWPFLQFSGRPSPVHRSLYAHSALLQSPIRPFP